jgi:hypothetical protein
MINMDASAQKPAVCRVWESIKILLLHSTVLDTSSRSSLQMLGHKTGIGSNVVSEIIRRTL